MASNRKVWVVKIGSSMVTNHGQGLEHERIEYWVKQIDQLRSQNIAVVIVSSGAVAEGINRLGWKKRPHAIHDLQAAAAVGQMGLIQAYESVFKKYNTSTAQILLTHDDLSNRQRYLNARSTLRTLLSLGVVPIVNENDTVVTDEIRFGDNDTLAALVANLVEAQQLILLTDQDGLYDADPRNNPTAQFINEADANDQQLEQFASSGSKGSLGSGGMRTKIRAAQRAARSGCDTIIAHGLAENILLELHQGTAKATRIHAGRENLAARKQWLASHLQTRGQLTLDAGAVKVLREQGSSLLAVGVTQSQGSFVRGDLVSCVDQQGTEVARGLINYDLEETRKLQGNNTRDIERILGYINEEELIHRDNLVLI